MDRKPFDLEAAKRGEPIETKCGCTATFLAHAPDVTIGLACIVDGQIETYNRLGMHRSNALLDLVMSPKVRVVWVMTKPNAAPVALDVEPLIGTIPKGWTVHRFEYKE